MRQFILPGRRLRCLTAGVLVSICSSDAHAQTSANVGVVINEGSPASRQIGEYYARTRGLPDANIIRIRASVDEVISREAYADSIERPIAVALTERGLQDRILFLVLTKGTPLRISGTAGDTGTAASVDSELTLLYRRLTGRSAPTLGRIDNPYYLGATPVRAAKPFTHRDYDIYLVTRLDAFTLEEALALVDRGHAPSPVGRILLDRRSEADTSPADVWLREAAQKLNELGHGDRVDLVETFPPPERTGAVLGYYSWGSNDPSNRRRRLGLGFVAGALAATLAGTDARTFNPQPEEWERAPQSLIGDLVREGATGVAGNVADPLLASSVRPQVLFPAYMSGFNLAEAFYLALPHLSWQGVIVGDPLCRPFAGRLLTDTEIEEPLDERTGLPGLLSNRRLDVVRARAAGVPSTVIALIVRAETQLLAGRKGAARSVLEEVTRLAPDLGDQQLQLALLYDEAAAYDEAAPRYRRVLDVQPRNAVALNNLAYLLAVHKRVPSEALPLAQKAAALAPQDAKVLDTLAWVNYLLDNHRDAARIVAEAIRRDSGTAEIRLHAAVVSFAVGSYELADTHLNEAIRLDAAYATRDDVRELRAKLQKRR